MTEKDFFCLTPLLIIAIAPVVIMIVISILRNYKVVYGFSVFSLLAAFTSLFFIISSIPHSIEPLFIIDTYSLFFLGIIIISALLVTLLSYDYIKQLDGVSEEYYIIIFTSTLGASITGCSQSFCTFLSGHRNTQYFIIHTHLFQRSKTIQLKQELNILYWHRFLQPFYCLAWH